MARALIIYYSRTGTTERLAKLLAEELKADLTQIRCERYRRGMFRYLRAGYDSVKGNLPPIELAGPTPSAYDLVVLATPIWTSHPALPMRSYLTDQPKLPAHVALVLTYGGHSPAETALTETEALLGRPLAASHAFNASEVPATGSAPAIKGFAKALLEKQAASASQD